LIFIYKKQGKLFLVLAIKTSLFLASLSILVSVKC